MDATEDAASRASARPSDSRLMAGWALTILRRPRVLRRLLQRLERLALGLRQLLRDGDLHACEQVAAALALQLRRAAAAQAEQLAVVGAGGHLQRHLAVRR